jgi:hypothetical protein
MGTVNWGKPPSLATVINGSKLLTKDGQLNLESINMVMPTQQVADASIGELSPNTKGLPKTPRGR